MSRTSGNSPQTLTEPPRPDERPRTPGWPEMAVGLAVLLALEFGLTFWVTSLGAGPTTFGVFMTALSAIVTVGGFTVAMALRIRSWSAFGVRRTSMRWLLIGAAGGLVATGLKIPLTMAYQALVGNTNSSQESWSELSGGGVLPIVLAFVFLGIATPIGEELFFRGVLTSALLRYGSFVGVVGSAVIFAVLHGLSVVVVSALIVGLIAAELRRRSGSIWPGVLLHIVFDLVGSVGLLLILPAGG